MNAKYSMAMAGGASAGFGVGYQMGKADKTVTWGGVDYTEQADMSIVGASVDLGFGNGLQTILNYSRMSSDGTGAVPGGTGSVMETVTHFGIGVGYTIGTVTIGGNWGSMETERVLDDDISDAALLETKNTETKGFGFSVTYGLGGGATLKLGMGSDSTETTTNLHATNSVTPDPRKENGKWSLGLTFAF